MRRIPFGVVFVVWLLGCASTGGVKPEDSVTLQLHEGPQIRANVVDISNGFVFFEAKDWKHAYDYGERINVERVKGVKLSDGTVLSVADYNDFRKGRLQLAKEEPVGETKPSKEAQTSPGDLNQVVESLIDAELAPAYLAYLSRKSGNGRLSEAEQEILSRLKGNPEWQDKIDEIEFLDHRAHKSLERAYLFSPEELLGTLGLSFNPDSEMDYIDLIDQLHMRMGSEVEIKDFRLLVDVFGEGGGKAMKELLTNYDMWSMFVKGAKN